MELFGKKFFEKKAVGDKTGFSYNGATFGFDSNLTTNTSLYYKLYRENTDLRRCVEELYQTVGKDGFKIMEGENEIKNQEIISALNYGNGFDILKNTLIRDTEVAANIFVIHIKNAGGKIIGFQILDPRTIRIVANKHGEVLRYIQTRGGNVQEFLPNEVFHFKDMIDPDNEVQGISKIETLIYDIMSDKESGRSNYAFFKNNAIPSTLITLDNGLDETEMKQAMATLKKQFTGGANKHKVSAAAGIKDVTQLSGGIKDMEFTALRGFTTERICSAMGVPKTILGYSDGVNYSTSDNQYRKYIENTIRPLQNQIEQMFNVLIKSINPNARIEFLDLNQFDYSQKITDFEKLVGIGSMTPSEVREELGLEELEGENTNRLMIKQGYELLEDVGVNEITPLPEVPKK